MQFSGSPAEGWTQAYITCSLWQRHATAKWVQVTFCRICSSVETAHGNVILSLWGIVFGNGPIGSSSLSEWPVGLIFSYVTETESSGQSWGWWAVCRKLSMCCVMGENSVNIELYKVEAVTICMWLSLFTSMQMMDALCGHGSVKCVHACV